MAQILSLLGASRSGKSTWIGCTLLARARFENRLSDAGLPEALAPLRVITTPLHEKRYPIRTNTSDAGVIRAPLMWNGKTGSVSFDLEIADFDGEEIEAIFNSRQLAWTDAWTRRAEPSVGLLLFLRPSKVERVGSARLTPSKCVPEPDSPERIFPGETPVEPDQRQKDLRIPTEVKLIEVMQMMRAIRGLGVGQHPPERLGILLTCWDEIPVGQSSQGPDAVFEDTFPLLYDFVYTNHNTDRVRVFGVSATGGNLADEAFIKSMEANNQSVADLGRLVWREGRRGKARETGEIALPLGWMVEGDDALR